MSKRRASIPCPYCKGRTYTLLYHIWKRGRATSENPNLRYCPDCDIIFKVLYVPIKPEELKVEMNEQ